MKCFILVEDEHNSMSEMCTSVKNKSRSGKYVTYSLLSRSTWCCFFQFLSTLQILYGEHLHYKRTYQNLGDAVVIISYKLFKVLEGKGDKFEKKICQCLKYIKQKICVNFLNITTFCIAVGLFLYMMCKVHLRLCYWNLSFILIIWFSERVISISPIELFSVYFSLD